MAKIKVVEVDEMPLCPHREQELNEIKVNSRQALWSLVQKDGICSCPHCRKVLGVTFTRSAF